MDEPPVIHITMIARIVSFDDVNKVHHTNYLTIPAELQDTCLDEFVRDFCTATNLPPPEWYDVAKLNPAGEWEPQPRIWLKQ